jgi:hypothetical protein
MSESFEKTDPDLISADLDAEIEAIFEKVDELLAPDTAAWLSPSTSGLGKKPESSESPVAPPTAALTGEFLEINQNFNYVDLQPLPPPNPERPAETGKTLELNISPADSPGSEPLAQAGQENIAADDSWVEPELLGDPEMPGPALPLTPEAIRELTGIIERAVAKGVAAALEKRK